jgi:lysophospholipase L1-like esterase
MGTGSAYAWGYREPLYVKLINGGYSFDFVGSLTNGSFADPNHEGHYGWRADEILNGRTSDPCAGKLANWLPASQPDIILLHIGTNDISQGDQDANEVNSILNVIDAYEATSGKNITVILALIINRVNYNSATTIYNNDLNTMATGRISNGDNIVIVNMENALNYSTDMFDNTHPNDNGYAKMANVWYNALVYVMTGQRTLNCSSTDGGAVTQPGEGVFQYDDGTVVNLMATADLGYHFVNWTGPVADPNLATTTITMDGAYAVIANFAIDQFAITGSAGANGSISPSGTFNKNYSSSQLFTAAPTMGYEVDKWTVDGNDIQTGGTTYTLNTITATHTIAVSFKIMTYTVTASADANGSIDPSGAITKDYGSSQLFTANPVTGHEVDKWVVDGNDVQTGGNTYTLSNITAPHTVAVSFKTLPLPGQASSPSPANAATNFDVNGVLSWTAGSGATSHDVYFGTAASPPFIQNQPGTTYDPTGSLVPGTLYYWRIDERNGSGATTGTVWSFTTSAMVPNVVDIALADANSAIISAGLVVGTITYSYSNTVAAGNVVSQNPSAGTHVPPGSSVNLVVSLGQPQVPNVVGSTQAAATTAITSVDNLTVSSTTAYSNTIAAGFVISQNPVGGTYVNIGSNVEIVVSLGMMPPTTIRSNGTGGGDWNTDTTWVEGFVPRTIDDVIIQGNDVVTLAATGRCAHLTMNAGTKLTITAGGPIPSLSWSLDPASTIEFNTVVPNSWVNPTFGNLIFNTPTYSLPTSITVAGDLSILNNTLRGIGGTSGTNIHNVSGNVIVSGTGRITAVNQSNPTSASCTWNIGGNLTLGSTSNRIQIYESTGPHSGSAVFNINGNLTVGPSSSILFKSTSATTADYPEGIINLKGNFVNNGTVNVNSTQSGASPGLTINFVGTSPQDWSGSGTISISSFSATMNINNPAGVTLSRALDISDRTAVALTNGKLTTTSTNLLRITNGSLIGGRSSSYINGPLGRRIAAGTQSLGFPVGDATKYTPVNLEFVNVSASGTITVNTTQGIHPQIAASGLDSSKTLNRYYTVTNTATFDNVTATFNFDPTDVIGGADPTRYIVKKFDTDTWLTPTRANPLETSIQAMDMTSFGDFAVGQRLYDLDGDGSIGYGDVAIISENWLKTGSDIPGDFDKNNIVNFLDFAEFGLAW